MKTNLITSALLTAVIAFSSCKKHSDATPNYAKADDFLSERAPATQTFTGNAGTGFSITGGKGTKITFPAGAFVDGNGDAVTGTVTVTLREVLNRKDILLGGPMTEANGQLLVSGGEILVKATKDGAALSVKPQIAYDSANGIKVEIPKAANGANNLQLFVQNKRDNGQGANGQSGPYVNPNTWTAAPYAPFGNGPNSYVFTLPSFTWINCDKFYSDPRPKTTITATPVFKDDQNLTDLQVMLVFKDINTVVTLPFSTTVNKFQSYLTSLPIGIEADMVIIGKDSQGYVEFGVQHITVGANQDYPAEVKRSTAADVDAYLGTIQ